MTDKDKLKKLFSEFGIGFEDDGERIVCTEGAEKVRGCTLFYTVFDFDADGSFNEMGIYE